MQAVILAAGEGRRLRPLTLETPKPLLKIKNKPILEYTFQNLPDKVREVILVIGYKGEQIENYFGKEFAGKKIVYSYQKTPNGTFHALVCAKKFLKGEPFLGLVGDDLYEKADLENLIQHPASVLVRKTNMPERFGICRVDENDFLIDIIEKPNFPCGSLAHTGAFVLNKEIFKELLIRGLNGEELLAPMIGSLAKKQPIKAVRASFWFPIGYLEDLTRAEKFLWK